MLTCKHEERHELPSTVFLGPDADGILYDLSKHLIYIRRVVEFIDSYDGEGKLPQLSMWVGLLQL